MTARHAAVAAALALLLPLAPAHADQAPSAARPAAARVAQLPDSSPLIGPLRRGANGEIELLTPEGERKAGRPLCARGAKCVGKGEALPTLAAALAVAHPGDTIDIIGGTYREAAVIDIPRLTLRGTAGRPHFDCAGVALANDTACLAIAADGVTLDNLEISGAAASAADTGTGSGACIHSDGNLRLTLSDVFCHASHGGLVATGGTIVIVHSEFFDNGGGNVELGRDCVSVTVTGSVFRDTRDGDEFSSGCLHTEISDSTFRSSRGARAIAFPVGGEAMIYRSTIEKTADAHAKTIIAFTDQSCVHRGSLRLKQVQIVNAHYDAVVANYDRCVGDPITAEQVGVEGLPVLAQGFIVDLGRNDLRGIVPDYAARRPPPLLPNRGPGAGLPPVAPPVAPPMTPPLTPGGR